MQSAVKLDVNGTELVIHPHNLPRLQLEHVWLRSFSFARPNQSDDAKRVFDACLLRQFNAPDVCLFWIRFDEDSVPEQCGYLHGRDLAVDSRRVNRHKGATMAEKSKAHIYRVSKSHAIAGKMKPGERMSVRMRMMDPDDDGDTHPMEEESAEPYTEQPTRVGKPKARTPAELLRQRRMAK